MTYDPLWQTTTAAFGLTEVTGTLPHAPPTSTPQNTVGAEDEGCSKGGGGGSGEGGGGGGRGEGGGGGGEASHDWQWYLFVLAQLASFQ